LKYKNKKFQISCDGGAATGKSTGAKMISKKFNLKFLSSGLLYRYAAYLFIKNNPKNITYFLKRKFKNLNYKKLEKKNLHTQEISEVSARLAKLKTVRNVLKNYQLNFSKKNKKCCIEGRDISTKILPKSNIKFFFKCDLNTAALRRFRELKKTNPKINIKEVKKALKIRNLLDTKRKNSPLLKHRDSIVIDTGKLSKQAMLNKMTKYVERVINKR